MKTFALASLAVALLAAPALATSGKGKAGYCQDDKACANSYSCVSVQTTRANVEDVKQCLPNNAQNAVCAGTQPGLCPSFSTTWGENFREISSVCAYIIPQTKAKCVPKGSNSSKSVIECYMIQDPDDPKNSSAQIGVIYGCVDFDGTRLLFKKDDKSDKIQSQLNYTAIINDKCVNPKNPSGSTFVCSSQGTCTPSSQNAFGSGTNDYSCKCNIGFSGKYCEKIDNNKCYNDGVCGGGSCDLTTNECTNCKAGTTGPKCSQCVPSAVNVCGGHGKCVQTNAQSTLGADDGSSSSSKTSTSTGSASGAADDAVGDGSSANSSTVGKVVAAGYRRLASTSGSGTVSTGKVFQCQCDEGYSDVHCGVKLTVTKSKNSSSTTATTAPSSGAAGVSMSVVAVIATVASVLAL